MKKRVFSAVILIAITLACVFLSYVTRVLFFAAAGILCAYEFSRNVEKLEVYCCAWVMYVYIVIQALLTLFHAGVIAYISCMAGGIYLALFSGILHKKVSGSGALYTLAGLSYPCFLFGLLMAISVSSIWKPSLVIAAISTWVCDSFALFGGLPLRGAVLHCGRRSSVRAANFPADLPAGLHHHRSAVLHAGPDRRSGGVPHQAHDRRKGLQQSDSRPRRHV